jgi:hypothetical protein
LPYWVDSLGPVKVPDFPAGALELGAVVAGDAAFLLGVVERVAVGVVAVVLPGAAAEDDGFGVLFFAADLDGVALAEGFAVGAVIGAAVMVGVIGDVLATAMPARCVLYENSAASPAAVVPRTTTARRMQPPVSD